MFLSARLEDVTVRTAPTESTRKVQGKRSANAVIKETISMSDTIELFMARDRERVCVCVCSAEKVPN